MYDAQVYFHDLAFEACGYRGSEKALEEWDGDRTTDAEIKFKQECADFLEEVVNQLYIAPAFDASLLEHCLEELCYKLQVKFPEKINLRKIA